MSKTPAEPAAEMERPRPRWRSAVGPPLLTATLFAAGLATAYWLQLGTNGNLRVEGPSAVTINHTDRRRPLRHVFMLKNPSSGTIRVHSVNASCACLTTRLASVDVPARSSIPLEVEIFSFDEYRPTYQEVVQVVTDGSVLNLTISGNLPLPKDPLYRPRAVFMEPLPMLAVTEREVLLRVPKQLCRELSDGDLRVRGCQGLSATIVEEPPSGLFREFRVTLSAPSAKCRQLNGDVSLDTGAGEICIKVQGSRD